MAGSLGGPLQLQDEGSFFVNGQQTASTHPGTAAGGISQPGTITVNQMYVQYRIPQERARARDRDGARLRPYRRHLRDDAGRTRGLGDLFRAQGLSGLRGRPFRPRPLGLQPDARSIAPGRNPMPPCCPISRSRRASAPGTSSASARPIRRHFPARSFRSRRFDQYTAQLVPNAEATLPGAGANTVQALGALLDKIGPAVVMVHSQSGAYGMDLVRGTRDQDAGLHQRRRQLRAGDAGRGRRRSSPRSRCCRCGATTARARPGRTATSAATAASATVNARQVGGRRRQVPAAARGRPEGQQPHADDGQEQPADRRPDHRLDRRERPRALTRGTT